MAKVKIKYLFFVLLIIVFNTTEVFGYMIDNMENFSNYSTSADDGTSDALYGLNIDDRSVIYFVYSFTTGTWVQVERDFGSIDLRKGDSIRFKYKGGGTNNDLEVKLIDSDTDTFGAKLVNSTSQSSWTTATLKYEGAAPDFTYWWGDGDKLLDTGTINKLEFAVSSASGQGYVIIDDLEVYQSQSYTDTTLDDFEDGDTTKNYFGGVIAAYTEDATVGCTMTIIDTDPYEGSKCMQIYYNRGSKWCAPAFALNSVDLHLATHLQFYIKAEKSSDNVNIELGSAGKTYKLTLSNIPTEWKKITVLLDNYKTSSSEIPDTGWYAMTGNLAFVFEGTTSLSEDTVYIDDIKFTRTPASPGSVYTIDDFEGPYLVAYSTSGENDASVSASQVPGYSGYGLRLDYTMNSGSWVSASNELYADFNRGTGVRFQLYGGSATKDLEVKLQDSDGTVFYKKLYSYTGVSTWKTVDIPFTEMTKFSSGDNDDLALSKIAKIQFAVSGSGAASGSIMLDDIEVLDLGNPNEIVNKGIIYSVKVENNPFSPNNDGVKDYVTFRYSLKEAAQVKFEVLDSTGNRIADISPSGVVTAGNNYIIWDGKSIKGNRVRNGLYLFHIDAEGINGGAGKYTNIVAVIR